MIGSEKQTQEQLKHLSGIINIEVNIYWFRRDLRLNDNTGLFHALTSGKPVILLFIFDENILSDLPDDDPRVSFIYDNLLKIHRTVSSLGSSLLVLKGDIIRIWHEIKSLLRVNSVFWNIDYEPYAIKRDNEVREILHENGI